MNINDILSSLNNEQREAASTIEGPVFVSAAAGSGKTHLLSSRVGAMLLDDSVIDPSSILLLTFTDAGAKAMRQRIFKMFGKVAYNIYISTFHGFCNDVIQKNLNYFGAKELEAVSELEQNNICREIINTLPYDNPLRKHSGNIYFEVPRMIKLFGMMKQENITPNEIRTKVSDYQSTMHLDDNFIYKRGNSKRGIKKGDFNKKKADEFNERLEKLIFAAGLFDLYNKS